MNIHIFWAGLVVLGLAMTVSGCSSGKRPVLYPNAHYLAVGQQRAEMDIDDCMAMAEYSRANAGRGTELARNTARAGAVGGATGAVVGAISPRTGIGTGAAIGGAGAATATLVKGAFDAGEPTDIFMRFVNQCLQERGYQSLGWR
ncbi:MAG: hypothetical protein ACK5PS_07560 [Desulfopila sp.]